ncbi:B12-binding domain-containing radical SAM protein [Thermodesulfobacteriota bacterium]
MQLKLILINAWEKGCSDTNFLSPPIGLWRIKSFLDRYDHKIDIEVFDPNLYEDPYSELDRLFLRNEFHIIGFSPLYLTLENDISLMLYLLEKNPDSLFIAGGQEAAFDHQFLFDRSPIQIIVVGEGEKPMLEILRKIQIHGLNGINDDLSLLMEVPGLYLKNIKGSAGDGTTAHLAPLTQEEFTDITFLTDFSEMPINKYWNLLASKYSAEGLSDEDISKKIYTIKPFTSSFCPFRCIFCSSTNFFRKASGCYPKIASLSAEHMYEYLKLILKNQPLTRTILFKDDNFFVRGFETDVREILIRLKKLKGEYPFLSFAAKARIDTFAKNPGLLDMCKEAGFFFISYGVESFSKKELNYMAKGIDPLTSKQVLKKTRELGINSVAYVILTTPVTEVVDMFTTIDECINLIGHGDTVKMFTHLIPIPGSLLAKDNEIKDLITTKEFRIPGYDMKIEKAIKVNPRDEKTRELINEYECRIDEESEMWKKKFGGRIHFVSEISTLIKFRLLYEIAKEKKFVPTEHAEEKIEHVESMIFPIPVSL